MCNNFKDPGVQHYGGDVFREVRDIADDKFNELPPPIPTANRAPSRPVAEGLGGAGHIADYNAAVRASVTSGVPAAPAAFSMSLFNSAQGSCFLSGAVELANGDVKDISLVEAGDVLATADGIRRVACVVVSPAAEDGRPVVDLGNGVVVTPWHPVRAAGGSWVFPADLRETERRCGAVYSLLLENASSFRIGGWDGIALGHGESGPVAGHAFFASRDAVVRSLRTCGGFDCGRVVIAGVRRSTLDGLIVGFISAVPAPELLVEADSSLQALMQPAQGPLRGDLWSPPAIAVS
jgi:hypothetical protein